jgi:glycine dehydrogenase subunit 1
VRLPAPAAPVVDRLAEDGVFAGVPAARLFPGEVALADHLILCATELNTADEIERLGTALEGALR